MRSPLENKTVVVTRPREQAAELKFELERLGATVVLFSTIEIAAPDSCADLDDSINNLSVYDWLIFTSSNAVEHFLNRLEANDLDVSELDYLRVCAVGEATFERLRLAQIHVDISPNEQSANGVFTAIIEYLSGETELENLRFLFPRSAIARDLLPQKLRELGAIVDDPVAYQTILPRKPETGKIKALLQSGAIDCIAFSSPSTFKNFVQILADINLKSLLESIALACIGETTAQTARENGFAVPVVAPEPNAAAFAKAIADALE